MNKKKEMVLASFSIFFGIVIGLAAKYSNEVIGLTFYDKLFHSIDLVTAGLFIWLVICYILANISENKWLAIVNVLLFLTFMMIAYYLYCYFALDYFPDDKIKFWFLMLIPCAGLAYLAKSINKSQIVMIIFLIIGVLVMAFDIVFIQKMFMGSMIMEAILFVIYTLSLKYLR